MTTIPEFEPAELAPRYSVINGQKVLNPYTPEEIEQRRRDHQAWAAELAQRQQQFERAVSLRTEARKSNGRRPEDLAANELRTVVAVLLLEKGWLDAAGNLAIPEVEAP